MKHKVLIIEDEFKDFARTAETLLNAGFEVIPSYIDKGNNNFNELSDALNNMNIQEYTQQKIIENISSLKAIICEIGRAHV